MATSKVLATCGRIVLLFCNQWTGPRPATVLSGTPGPGEPSDTNVNRIDCNVQLHGKEDADLLASIRNVGCGNTFTGVPLYDAGKGPTAQQECQARHPAFGEAPIEVYATWIPYAGGGSNAEGSKAAQVVKNPAEIAAAIGAAQVTSQPATIPASISRDEEVKDRPQYQVGVDPAKPGADQSVTMVVPATAKPADPAP